MIFETVHGSHLYGLAHEDSDMDLYKVYEGAGDQLKQSVHAGVDVVRGDLEAFLLRALSGSHQSCEALFSLVKQFSPGMQEKWGPFLSGLRVGGPEVYSKYERTITKFCYGDYKRRRHAIRLRYNLQDIRESGRFNPRMTPEQIVHANRYAHLEGDNLRGHLFDG